LIIYQIFGFSAGGNNCQPFLYYCRAIATEFARKHGFQQEEKQERIMLSFSG